MKPWMPAFAGMTAGLVSRHPPKPAHRPPATAAAPPRRPVAPAVYAPPARFHVAPRRRNRPRNRFLL